ncbi:MAG: phospholipase D family protein [Candidatus Didemnitutus sp.]|nr:phospholipase D family protein [Candidatus Didemnitutus sp.]
MMREARRARAWSRFGLALCAVLAGAVALAAAGQLGDSPLAEPAVAAENRLLRIESGYDALLLRLHLIRAARESVEMQTFIWTNDECGRLLLWELIEAARRGVRVRLLVDQMFSEKDPATIAFLATVHPNLQIKHYRPAFSRIDPAFWQKLAAGALAFRSTNQRMHNKVMIVDGAALVTGGRNVENTYFDHSTELNFRDRDVLATGPVVAAARASFEEFWAYRHAVPSQALRDVAAQIARGKFPRYDRREEWDFGGLFGELQREADDAVAMRERFAARMRPVQRVTFVADEPGKMRGWFAPTARITRELRRTIERAHESIVMQTPYLVLSPAARDAVAEMRERHPALRVRISTNSLASTDNLMAYSANYRLRGTYIAQLGLEVHEAKPRPAAWPEILRHADDVEARAAARLARGEQKRAPFLCVHAKSLVVDDAVAFVGSYNLDPRSERLNTEAGLLIEDAEFARALRTEIDRDLRAENSWVVARREIPLGLDKVNGLIGGVLAIGPVDLWPLQNTANFELRPGAVEVPPGHVDFHRSFRDVGAFPGTDGWLSQKEIFTRVLKAVGAPLTPIL